MIWKRKRFVDLALEHRFGALGFALYAVIDVFNFILDWDFLGDMGYARRK